MKVRKRTLVLAFTAISLSFAANSLAMTGGGGMHGRYQERYSSGSHHGYDNYRPGSYDVRVQWYDYNDHYSGNLHYRDNVSDHYQGHHGNYSTVGQMNAPRNYHRRGADVYVPRRMSNKYFHHE